MANPEENTDPLIGWVSNLGDDGVPIEGIHHGDPADVAEAVPVPPQAIAAGAVAIGEGLTGSRLQDLAFLLEKSLEIKRLLFSTPPDRTEERAAAEAALYAVDRAIFKLNGRVYGTPKPPETSAAPPTGLDVPPARPERPRRPGKAWSEFPEDAYITVIDPVVVATEVARLETRAAAYYKEAENAAPGQANELRRQADQLRRAASDARKTRRIVQLRPVGDASLLQRIIDGLERL